MFNRLLFLVAFASPLGCTLGQADPLVDANPTPEASSALGAASDSSDSSESGGVQCYVFNDGYTSLAGPSDAVYVLSGSQACIPDGTATGTCRKWFGRCFTTPSASEPSAPVYFRVFQDGYADQSIESDAVYMNSPGQACIPDGTPRGACRKWFGRAFARPWSATRPVTFLIFADGYNYPVGPSDAIFWNGSQLCVPDGTPEGTCRKWFGRGSY